MRYHGQKALQLNNIIMHFLNIVDKT